LRAALLVALWQTHCLPPALLYIRGRNTRGRDIRDPTSAVAKSADRNIRGRQHPRTQHPRMHERNIRGATSADETCRAQHPRRNIRGPTSAAQHPHVSEEKITT